MQEKNTYTIVTIAGIIIGIGLFLYGRNEEIKIHNDKDIGLINQKEAFANEEDFWKQFNNANIKNLKFFCLKCGESNLLTDTNIKEKSYTCNKCNCQNKISIELTDETKNASNDFFCQKCGVENELDDEEINNKMFNCSKCNFKNIIS